jgi:hypothetical protein
MPKTPVFRRLRIFNAVMGVFHLVQGVAIIAISNDFALPVTTSFLNYIEATERLEPVRETLIDLRIGPLVGIFLLLSAVAHFLLASPRLYPWYVRNLKRHVNYLRWYEYTFSASLMIVVIAMLSGIYDVAALILIFALNATMLFFGLLMEIHNQTTERTNWTAYNFGCIAGIVPWIAIAVYFFGSISNATETVPTFVYYILLTLFVFFFLGFGLNMFLQYKKVGPWRNYLFGERMYIILSLVAKSALAWQVFSGTLRPM